MILLQAQSGGPSPFIFISLILRIIGTFVCSSKAKKLNRDTISWGIFGFVAPVIAMIWVNCIKPKVNWDNNVDNNKQA